MLVEKGMRAAICGMMLAAMAAPAQAQTMAASPAAVPAGKAPKSLTYLKPRDIDPRRLLPPPPAQGSAAEALELADLHRIITAATSERAIQAQWDDDHEDPTMYGPLLGPRFDLKSLPATAEVLSAVQNDASIAASAAKTLFRRKRPWAVDASIKTCDPNDKPEGSYPSGHATLGYALALVLAELMPDRAQAILARASDYAFSREICGSHFPSDTQASEALSSAFVSTLFEDPEFRAKLEAARRELRAANLAG